jgi:hypothetical protein
MESIDETPELLSNIDIVELAKQLKINLIACCFTFELSKYKPTNHCSFVINIGNLNIGGTHWTCLYIKNKSAIYYDSFGENMPQECIQFLKKNNIKYKESMVHTQEINDTSCGYYCLAFLKYMNNKEATQFNLNVYNKIYETDLNKLHMNRGILQLYIKSIFK